MSRKSLLALALFLSLIPATAGDRGAGPTSHRRSAIATASLDTTAAARAAAGPFDLPPSFVARGRGGIRITGDPDIFTSVDLRFRGTFTIAYSLDGDGRVTISRFQAPIHDTTIISTVPFFPDERTPVRCASATIVEPVLGTVDAAGNLTIPRGAADISAISFTAQGPDGCAGRVTAISARNNNALRGLHDPERNQFRLEGNFTGRFDGDDYNIKIEMAGTYFNRPPVAKLGVDGPGVRLAQGGCPPLNTENPPTTEANHPLGLQVNLISTSVDPDSRRGTPDRSDILLEQWYHNRGGDPYEFLGRGQVVGPALFEFGPLHRLVLRVTDRAGASSTDGCVFTVADRTPPLVIAPERVTIPCSEPGGASLRTSEPLRTFLTRAKARDNSDPAPAPLPPQITRRGSRPVDITESTLFPTDPRRLPDSSSFTPVTFRFRDRHGNLGTASSGVRVVGRASPVTTMNLDAVADANTVSSQPSVSFGTKSTLVVQFEAKPDVGLLPGYAYLRFDLSSIPRGAVIQSAELQLYLSQWSGPSPYNVEVYGLSQPWNESTINWANQPPPDKLLIDTQTVSPLLEFKRWTITKLVQEWINGSRTNQGLVLVPKNVLDAAFSLIFNSRDASSNRPRLVIQYTTPAC